MFGFDLLVGTLYPAKFTPFGERREEGYQVTSYGPMCIQSVKAMHEMIAGASRAGQNLVVDHLMFLDPPVLQDCIWRLEGLPVLFVNLKPPREILEKRLRERVVDIPAPTREALEGADSDMLKLMGEELAAIIPWFYENSYKNDIYDIEIDSNSLSPEEVADKIDDRLKMGRGEAFETLRKIHERPDW